MQRGDAARPSEGAFPFESDVPGWGDEPAGAVGSERPRHVSSGAASFNVHPDLTDLPEEQPVTIEINGHPVAILLCTPENLAELAAGWTFAQGFVKHPEELRTVTPRGSRVAVMIDAPGPGGSTWNVILGAGFDAHQLTVPGLTELGLAPLPVQGAAAAVTMSLDAFLAVVSRAFEAMRSERGTGGFHHATLVTAGRIDEPLRDISRHNAVDKVIGRSLLSGLKRDRSIICLSGRVTADIVHKAWRAQMPVIASRALPSSEAVELAHAAGVTLVGRVLDKRRTVYTHAWRLMAGEEGNEANLRSATA